MNLLGPFQGLLARESEQWSIHPFPPFEQFFQRQACDLDRIPVGERASCFPAVLGKRGMGKSEYNSRTVDQKLHIHRVTVPQGDAGHQCMKPALKRFFPAP